MEYEKVKQNGYYKKERLRGVEFRRKGEKMLPLINLYINAIPDSSRCNIKVWIFSFDVIKL